MSSPPLATVAILQHALPRLLIEWTIFPPSFVSAASVWNVFDLEGSTGAERLEPYSIPTLPNLISRKSLSPLLREKTYSA